MLNCIEVSRENITGDTNVYQLFKQVGIRPSIAKLEKLASMGGLRINNEKVDPGNLKLSNYPAIGGCLYVIKSGKKEYFSLIVK